jgi:hypothetical protein
MASHSDVFHRCLQEAANASALALEHCIDHAVSALQVAEAQSIKASERDELDLAWRELLKHKDRWCAQYPHDLLTAFNSMTPDAAKQQVVQPPPPRPSMHAKTADDMFSLVDNAQVEEDIESSRLLLQVAPAVEQVLAELNGLMSSAQGLGNVSPELNPVRPEVYTQALRTLMAGAPVAPAISALWIKHLAEPLGRELKRVYERLVNLLELAQVRAANYRVLPTPASTGKKNGGPKADASVAPAKAAAGGNAPTGPIGYVSDEPMVRHDLSNDAVKDELFQDFLFHGGSNAGHGLAPAYYATIEEELIALKAARDSAHAALQPEPPPPADRGYRGTRSDPGRPALPALDDDTGMDSPSRMVDVLSQLSSQVWGVYGRARERAMVHTQLKKNATRVGQVLGMEVVEKLVSQVAQDPRLLVPVREAIVALEPSLLRLAMVDSRFFSEENHPGRRFMERVAQRSFKYNDESSPEFGVFFQSVTETVNTLNALTIEDARPFDAALSKLQNLWAAQEQQEQAQRRNMRQTLQFAEERQAQADQIAFDISTRPDLDHVPGVVLDFLFGPWALVLAHTRLTHPARQIDPEGYSALVSDLLWSVKPQVTLKRPAQLIAMIPGLLSKLHSGLASLGQDARETETFFQTIEKLHHPVLKLRRVRSRRDAAESAPAPLEVAQAEAEEPDLSDILPATPEQRKARAASQPWLAQRELDAAGFEEAAPSGADELNLEPSDVEPAPPPAAEDSVPQTSAAGDTPSPEQILLGLREGSWVDLYSKRRWLRAQLIWTSNRGALFMFVSQGGQPHSMTKRSCERLIRGHLLRPVETHGVVAQALDSLVKDAAPADTEGTSA